jgi:hypothetical protein
LLKRHGPDPSVFFLLNFGYHFLQCFDFRFQLRVFGFDGPQLVSRGNLLTVLRIVRSLMLQWGRGVLAAEIVQGPFLEARSQKVADRGHVLTYNIFSTRFTFLAKALSVSKRLAKR